MIVRSLSIEPIARSQVADGYKTIRVYAPDVSEQKEAKVALGRLPFFLVLSPLFPPFFSIMNVRATEKSCARHMAVAKSGYRRNRRLLAILPRITYRVEATVNCRTMILFCQLCLSTEKLIHFID